MARGHRSARGEIVDFDLLRIKENLGASPKASTVKAREDFIDNKFKRRQRRMLETVVAPAVAAQPAPVVETPAPVVEVAEVAPTPAPTKKKIIKAAE